VAADFTLDVPVRVQNVPSLINLTVDCYVSRVLTTDPYPAGGTNVIGRGSASTPVSGGSFDGTLTIEIDNTGIIPSSSARSYSCAMRGAGRATTGAGYTASSGNFAAVIETATGQTLDRATVTTRANLP
jgi:hypothetical protein